MIAVMTRGAMMSGVRLNAAAPAILKPGISSSSANWTVVNLIAVPMNAVNWNADAKKAGGLTISSQAAGPCRVMSRTRPCC